jgi:hypothetical protein
MKTIVIPLALVVIYITTPRTGHAQGTDDVKEICDSFSHYNGFWTPKRMVWVWVSQGPFGLWKKRIDLTPGWVPMVGGGSYGPKAVVDGFPLGEFLEEHCGKEPHG